MTKEDKFKVWEYYYGTYQFNLISRNLSAWYPCRDANCTTCQMRVDYKCCFNEYNGLTPEEKEEFYNLHPEYKIIS